MPIDPQAAVSSCQRSRSQPWSRPPNRCAVLQGKSAKVGGWLAEWHRAFICFGLFKWLFSMILDAFSGKLVFVVQSIPIALDVRSGWALRFERFERFRYILIPTWAFKCSHGSYVAYYVGAKRLQTYCLRGKFATEANLGLELIRYSYVYVGH